MASVKRENIKYIKTPVIPLNALSAHVASPAKPPEQAPSLLAALSSLSFISLSGAGDEGRPAAEPYVPDDQATITIAQYHPGLTTGDTAVVGPNPRHALLLPETGTRVAFFHAGCAYAPGWSAAGRAKLLCTSKVLEPQAAGSRVPVVVISRITLGTAQASAEGAGENEDGGGESPSLFSSVEWQKLRTPQNLHMPAGVAPLHSGLVYCAQGTLEPWTAGLFYMPRGQPPRELANAFCGHEFNSPWGLAVQELAGEAGDGTAKSAAVWFTDPAHGFEGDFRPAPTLPQQLYRAEVREGPDGQLEVVDLRAMADGFRRPMGVAVDARAGRVYVADAGAASGEDGAEKTATVYAFDMHPNAGSVYLTNRRLFSFARRGVPAGLLCDGRGNVYAGCSDGVEIWNEGGALLGVIRIPGGACGLSFGRDWNELFLASQKRLWCVMLGR